MKKLFFAAFLILCYALPVQAAVIGQEVDYSAAGLPLRGYLAYDDAVAGRRPGILVVHEWWGHNEYARKRARMLAEAGYVALAVDMYGEGKQAAHPDEAGRFAAEVREHQDAARQRFLAAMDVLKRQAATDPERIGAIGYCFGGGVVLQMARDGLDMKGVVSFHGALATESPAQRGRVKARILVCHGADDSLVPLTQVRSFIEEMTAAGVSFQLHSYPGARHSFTSPEADSLGARFNLPLGYNQAADRQSWQEMLCFFKEIFQ